MIVWCPKCEIEPIDVDDGQCQPCLHEWLGLSPEKPWVVYREDIHNAGTYKFQEYFAPVSREVIEEYRDDESLAALRDRLDRQFLASMDRDFWDMVWHGPHGDRPHIIRSEN